VKVTLERLPQSRVLLEIEVEQEKLEQSLEAEYRKFAAKARVPGFRPGKAPRPAIERQMGGAKNLRAALLDDAIQRLIPSVYNEAIAEQDVDAIDQPQLELVELEPVKFKATVPVRPSIELGNYQAVRVLAEPVEVPPEQIDEQIRGLQRRHATIAPVERPAQWDDHVTATVKAVAGEEELFNDEDATFPLREGETMILPGLLEAFIGMSVGETKSVELTFAEDFQVPRLAGSAATFELTVKELKEEQLPELDDEFANMVNPEQFETFQALEDSIRESLESRAKAEYEQDLRMRALDLLVAGSEIDLPEVLIEREIDRIIQSATGNSPQAYQQQLARIGTSEPEFRANFREAAEARVRRSLVLSRLSEAEAIEVTPEEVEEEIEKLVGPMGEESQRFRELFLSEAGQEPVRRDLITRKTLDRLVEIATNSEPVSEPPAAEPEAPVAEASSEEEMA
jgi:trigger factor